MQEDSCNREHLQINSNHISSRWGGLGGQFWSPWLPEGDLCRRRSSLRHISGILSSLGFQDEVAAGGWRLGESCGSHASCNTSSSSSTTTSQETFPRSGGKKTCNYNKLPLPAPPLRHRHVNVVKTDKKVGDP